MDNEKKEIWSGSILIFLAIVLLFAFGFSGCSPIWHVKRAIKKDPTILVKDTIKFIDTFTVHSERVEIDSVFIVSSDTTVIIKDNLTIRHFIHNDSVFIYGVCDTTFIDVVREVKIPFDKIVINDPIFPRWIYWILALFVLVVLLNKFWK